MNEAILTDGLTRNQIRAELEAMIVGDLLGPTGGECEERTEHTVRHRYVVGSQIAIGLGYRGAENGRRSGSPSPARCSPLALHCPSGKVHS